MRTHVILLIEDNTNDVDMTLWAFNQSNLNAEIVVAHDGSEALELLLPADQCTQLRPTIVLLDVNVPGMDGLGVLQRLRANPSTKTLPVVMLTELRADRDRIESHNISANGYVRKPVNASEFLYVARTIGAYWLSINLQPSSGVVPP
jgi:two-component system response regulator